jgi:DNA-binding transcriptional regulator YiaG
LAFHIKRFRDRHGVTQQQLADKLPMSLRRVEVFEQGDPVPPRYLKRALRDLERQISEASAGRPFDFPAA